MLKALGYDEEFLSKKNIFYKCLEDMDHTSMTLGKNVSYIKN